LTLGVSKLTYTKSESLKLIDPTVISFNKKVHVNYYLLFYSIITLTLSYSSTAGHTTEHWYLKEDKFM